MDLSMHKDQETQYQSLEAHQSKSVYGDNKSLFPANGRIILKFKIKPRTEIVEEKEEENSHSLANCSICIGPHIDSCVTVSPVVNLTESLRGWSVTGKRSRKILVGNASVDGGRGEEVDEDMQEAVSALLLLAQGLPKEFEGVYKKQRVEVSQDGYCFGSDSGRNFSSGVKKIEGKKLTNGHVCTICNKSFASHQALGGHMTSHSNKSKKIQTEDERQVIKEAAGRSKTATVSGEHICHKCNKSFPTGMALGGHMRCHWTRTMEAPSSSSQETSCQTEVTHTARKIHDFDLNEPAPEKDIDDQVIQPAFVIPVEAASAYASLLHN